MFDWYRPRGVATCPVCGDALDGWQGKHGPNALLVWEQGVAAPVDQFADDEWKPALKHLWEGKALPPAFEIHTTDDHDHWVSASCAAVDGVWRETRIVEVRELGDRKPLWRPTS
jgi:hypothetical protein